jgi:hypothetical protein
VVCRATVTDDGFLIRPVHRTTRATSDPGTGQMISTYIVELGVPLATLTS